MSQVHLIRTPADASDAMVAAACEATARFALADLGLDAAVSPAASEAATLTLLTEEPLRVEAAVQLRRWREARYTTNATLDRHVWFPAAIERRPRRRQQQLSRSTDRRHVEARQHGCGGLLPR